MSRLFWLTEEQAERIRPFFPNARGVGRGEDRRVPSCTVQVIKHRLPRTGTSASYGPPETLQNRFRQWSETGVFERIFEDLAKPQGDTGDVLMIDATHLNARRTASSLKQGGRAKDGPNTRLHALWTTSGGPSGST